MRHQPPDAAGPFNEALMELGALVCTPTSPRCDACPVAHACEARARGEVHRFPVKMRASPPRPMRVALAFARRGDLLLVERREEGLLAGTWGLPWVELADGEPVEKLGRHVAALTDGAAVVAPTPSARGEHVFTHRRWAMEAYEVRVEGAGGEWRRPDTLALGSAHRRILTALDAAAPQRRATRRSGPSRA